MIEFINGNLLSSNAPYICHQVNCRGVMGAGVAKAIRTQYPKIYQEYKEYLETKQNPLGTAQLVDCGEKKVINLFSQDGYGRDGSRYTDYNALRRSLKEVSNIVPSKEKIAMPYLIGCGLAGGDWNEVYFIIEEELRIFHVEFWNLS